MKRFVLIFSLLSLTSMSFGQSLELMLGHERLFADVQWLKFIDQDKHWSVFSRTRATLDYENNTDLFSGAYLNYTLPVGIGSSLVGRIGNSGVGTDIGVHIFKAKSNWMLFGLASVALKKDFEYSWFSIFRYTPAIKEDWNIYSSIELFSLFQQSNHLVSVQRLRLGLDYKALQFGIGVNLSAFGVEWRGDSNIGGFLRKEF